MSTAIEQAAKDKHSLIFYEDFDNKTGKKNTYVDWGLVPAKRPRIKKPPLKEHYIDLTGSDGFIDVTDLLSGGPTFGSREDSITFYIDYDRLKVAHPEWFNKTFDSEALLYNVWDELYDDVTNYLHGQYRYMVLSDNPKWHYQGRWEVNDFLSEANYSQIVLDYYLEPYKYDSGGHPSL